MPPVTGSLETMQIHALHSILASACGNGIISEAPNWNLTLFGKSKKCSCFFQVLTSWLRFGVLPWGLKILNGSLNPYPIRYQTPKKLRNCHVPDTKEIAWWLTFLMSQTLPCPRHQRNMPCPRHQGNSLMVDLSHVPDTNCHVPDTKETAWWLWQSCPRHQRSSLMAVTVMSQTPKKQLDGWPFPCLKHYRNSSIGCKAE